MTQRVFDTNAYYAACEKCGHRYPEREVPETCETCGHQLRAREP